MKHWLVPKLSINWFLGAIVLVLASGFAVAWYLYMNVPGSSYSGAVTSLSEPERESEQRMRDAVQALAGDIGPRSLASPAGLERAAQWIEAAFADGGIQPVRQTYSAGGVDVSNIIAEVRGKTEYAPMIVIGAHYDSVANSPGADDNASGVAVLIELARYAATLQPERTIQFVALVNEEMPWFGTANMGSVRFLRLRESEGRKIDSMLSLESLGYYTGEPDTQRYPAGLAMFYPDRGNFTGFIGNTFSRDLLHEVIRAFRGAATHPSEGLAGPELIRDIGRSDHWAFWRQGIPALMVTGTADFRNAAYHTSRDTPDTLDYKSMARLVTGLRAVVEQLSRNDPDL